MSVLINAKAIGFATALSVCSLQAPAVEAAPINEVDYFSLTVGQTIDFDSIAGGTPPGTNYDDLLNFGGVLIGERFAGQTISSIGNSDSLSAAPTGPISVVPGAPGQNLAVLSIPAEGVPTDAVVGLGRLGFPNPLAIGEGAVAILFDNNQSQFGFQSLGGDLGSANFDFFRRDGSLIQGLTPTRLGSNSFGFEREGGLNDIAGISIWNTDPGGIAFDNIIFDIPGNDLPVDGPVTTPVSEPATLGLLAIGLVGLRFASRRRKSA